MATTNGAIEEVVKLIEKQHWQYTRDEEKPVIHTGVTGKNGQWRCLVAVGGNEDHVIFLSFFPCVVPPHKRAACSELLSRINFGLTHGCFELDFEDGEVRFRTCIPVIEGQVAPEMVEYLVFTNLFAVDRFFGPIMSVVFADVSPKEALRPSVNKSTTQPRFELN